MITVSVVESILNKRFCFYYIIISSVTRSRHPLIEKSSIKIHHFVCACVLCAHMCAWFKGRQLERESSTTWQRDLGKMQSLFFIFVLLHVIHVPLLKQMYHNVLCLFFNVEWFSSWAKLLNINGMSTICQSTTKTSCNTEFCFECVSKGSLWGLVRGEVCVVCLLSDLL